ncbi:MAG TPA: hypothetical protein VGM49_01740 [Candidatus Limnocylindrales bacterium]|jgi:hypothetical protein
MTSPATAARRNHKREAIGRVRAGLGALRDGSASIVHVEAPHTGFYVQFARGGSEVVGEAVGEANLPKLTVHHIGQSMRKVLPDLGWREPQADGSTSGNWSHTWLTDTFDEQDVAPMVVSTFANAFGIYPWALVVTASSDIDRR